MDLIDRAAARKSLGVSDVDIYCREMLDEQPTIEAVPLDKLCEWLEQYAAMECYACREVFGSCEVEEKQEVNVCNSRERWKAMLTKWMEG